MTDLSRRKLLTGAWRADKQQMTVFRPPWSVMGANFIAGCTRCHACVTACETGVLMVGSGGFPEIDFQRAECSFAKLARTRVKQMFLPQQNRRLGHLKSTFQTFVCLFTMLNAVAVRTVVKHKRLNSVHA